MDYRKSLLTGYYNLLNDSIIINGSSIEVGTKIADESNDFVRYYISADDDVSTFDDTIREVNVTLNCTSIQSKHLGDDSKVDEMISQIKLLINKDSLVLNNWKILEVYDMGVTDNSEENETSSIFVRTLIFRHFIEKI